MQKLITVLFVMGFLLSSNPSAFQAEDTDSVSQEEKISLDLKSVDIIELMRILSLKTGKTIVPGKDIAGQVTIFLNNVGFDDILDILVLSQGLACEKKGNIIYIISNGEYKRIYGKDYLEPRKMKVLKLQYAKPANVFNALSQLKSEIGKIIADEASGTIVIIDIQEKLELMEKTAKELDRPLETVVYDLNYAKSADAKTQLSAAITPGTGEVIIDERSSKAVVSDLPQKMERIKKIIKEIDEETRQVFIETEIIQVTLSDNFKRGIDWEKIFNQSLKDLDFVGTFPVSSTLSSFQKISVGSLSRDKFKVIFNLLDTYGDAQTLSQPKIAVVNNEEARILVGVREPYITGTSSQAETTTVTSEQVEFVDVGIKLKVTPVINKDGFINMKIKVESSSTREPPLTTSISRIPVVQTSEAETVVKVKDGVTILLGGLMEHSKKDNITGLPLLSRIPLIGALFSNREKEDKRTELVVFITPHLTRGDSALPGTEPEKYIPGKLLPEDMREKAISRKLEELERGGNY